MRRPTRPGPAPATPSAARLHSPRRPARALPAVIALAALGTAGCGHPQTSPTHPAGARGAGPVPDRPPAAAAAAASAAETFAAIQVAAAYVTANCRFSWREPYGQRERRAAGYLTPARARTQAPSPDRRAAWEASVVRDRLAGGCRVLDARVRAEAPNTPDRRYLRLVARRAISRDGRPPATDQVDYGLVLIRLDVGWRVDGPSYGG